jgi:hypothetical protein
VFDQGVEYPKEPTLDSNKGVSFTLITYQRAHILTLSRQWVTIPVIGKFFAVMLNVLQKEGVQKPNVMWIIPIKKVKPFKAGEEGPPASSKVTSGLKP